MIEFALFQVKSILPYITTVLLLVTSTITTILLNDYITYITSKSSLNAALIYLKSPSLLIIALILN